MIKVVLAEKPDQAREYGKALGKFEEKNGVIIVEGSPYISGEVHIVAARGHLFEYNYPKIDWNLKNLPIVDVDLKLALKKGDPDIKRRFKTIKDEVKKADEVIIGTDADREGERIAYTILSQIPGGLKKATKRLWINSMTSEGIRKSFTKIRKSSETKNYYYEAEARSQSDWLVGFNLSPLVTLDLQRQDRLARKKGNAMSVGRVQTPTVKIICDNDLAIKNFVSQPFWKVELIDTKNDVVFSNEQKFLVKEQAEDMRNQLNYEGKIVAIEPKINEKSSPKLFDLTSLQSYGANHWKKSSDEILKIVQSLYEKKFLTYPRTDLPYITHFEFEYLKKNFQNYQDCIDLQFPIENSEPRKKYVNDSKVKEHFAIIPTEEIPNLTKLSEDEQLVYKTVVKRTLLMFSGNFIYESTLVKINNNGVDFSASGTVIKKMGFKEFSDNDESKNKILPNYQLNEMVSVNPHLKEDKTKSPSRITEATLMGKIFPKYGLGTPATRASIIETVQRRGYIRKDKKSGELFPTDRAYLLMDYLGDNEFANPETTGGWEYFLKKIGEGQLENQVFISGIKEKISNYVNKVKRNG